VLCTEQVFQFEQVELQFGGVDFRGDPLLRLTEIDEHFRVGNPLFEGGQGIEFAANRGRLVQNRAGHVLIGPKRRTGHDVL
jgi:hypothetical protein